MPQTIKGIWKADLFLGFTDSQRWVGTTIKINRTQLEGAEGLRIAIVPASPDKPKSDLIYFDDNKNLLICPLPYDGSFMQVFYEAWQIVKEFINAKASMPKEDKLPYPLHRIVVNELCKRKEYTVLEVIDELTHYAQLYLLESQTQQVNVQQLNNNQNIMGLMSVIAPYSFRI